MRTLLCWLLLALAVQAQPLTVDQALVEAEANSPALREAEARVQEAVYGVDEAGTGGNPRVGLSAGYQFLTPRLDFQSPGGPLPIVVNHNYEFAVSLQQTLADFGRLHWSTASAELRRQSLQEEVRRQRDELRAQVRQACAGLWLAGQSRQVADQLVASRQAHVELVDKKFQAGAVARYDLVSSQAALAEAREQQVTAASQEVVARAQLLMLLGRPMDQTVELAPPEEPAACEPDLATAVQQAQERRPELTSVNKAVEAAQARVRLEQSMDNPTLSFETRYAQRTETAFQTGSFWSTGLLFTVPLYDGGVSEARTGQAEAVVVQLEQSREKLRRLVGLEVQEAYQGLLTARQQQSLARARLEQTTEGLRIARLRYQTGVSVNQEVLDAESRFSQSQLGLRQAEYQLRVARARWSKVTAEEP